MLGGTDFAYGGAETGSTPQNPNNLKSWFPAPSQIQLISLPSSSRNSSAAVQATANALYTLSIGSNDLLDILGQTGLTAQQQTTDVNDAVANEIIFINAGRGRREDLWCSASPISARRPM